MEITFEKFCDDIAEILKVDKKELMEADSIVDELGIDSLRLLELSTKLESMYNLKYSSASFIEMESVSDLYSYTKKLLEVP